MTRRRIKPCKQCGTVITLDLEDGVWTVFCSPEHCYEWQQPRTEDEIIEQTGGWGRPYDRCQWCACTLKSGYHDRPCPVRDLQRPVTASA